MYTLFHKLIGEKKEYRQMMARVALLPASYQFLFKKIQTYMWNFAAGSGHDMLKIQYELIELFEEGAHRGAAVLDITGQDVAAFSDALLKRTKTYTENLREKLNREVLKELGTQS